LHIGFSWLVVPKSLQGGVPAMAPEPPPGIPENDEALTATSAPPSVPGAGLVIGPYHLLELIGEGGMGEVWLAEQRKPVRRRVALKLIKAGMDTREPGHRRGRIQPGLLHSPPEPAR
jgi:hypothetical protein